MPGKMARSDPRPSVRVTRGVGSGQHLASVLQEGRENANIDAGLGFIWRISDEAAERGLPPRHPGTAHERSILYEFSDALGAEERAELEREWREEFDRSWAPGFSVCKEGRIFTGQIARELHWIWADLPLVFHDQWMAERQRRGWTIRELED